MNTHSLLNNLKDARLNEQWTKYNYFELKAELQNRPHIHSKSERKAISKHNKKTKK